MCNVCDAWRVLEAQGEPVVFFWEGHGFLEVRCIEGTQAEFTRAVVQIRRTAEDSWSPSLVTEDLAGLMSRLGTDIKWQFVPEGVRDWVLGTGPMPSWEKLRVTLPDAPVTSEGEVS